MLEKKKFPIEMIYVPTKRIKTLDPEKVIALANDILENGQTTPIRVRADAGRFVLIDRKAMVNWLRSQATTHHLF